MSPPFWLVPAVLITGLITWVGIHLTFKSKKIDMSLSRIVMMEMVPAFVFAVTLFYLFVPSLYYLLLAERIGWASTSSSSDVTWRLATFVGAAALSLSPIGWINLLDDKVAKSTHTEELDRDSHTAKDTREEGTPPKESALEEN